MAWYTISLLFSCRLKCESQEVYPVYENFTLFEAMSRKQAIEKAEHYAKEYAQIEDDLTLDDKPAYWKFEGIRKAIEIRDYFSDELDLQKPGNGTEVSYSYYEVDSENQIQDMAKGEAVFLRYVDAADD